MSHFGSMTVKAATIGGVVLILLVPLAMLGSLVAERTALREKAYARVADGWGGKAVVGGPMLIVPIERVVELRESQTQLVRSELYLLPVELEATVDLNLERERRYVGIYAVPVYLAAMKITGRFDRAGFDPPDDERVRYRWDQARLQLPLAETRSLREVREASFGGTSLKLRPAASASAFRGVEATVDASALLESASLPFAFDVVIAGSREFSMLPTGSTTSVQLQSNWPHPSFQGSFLPVERSIASKGFTARWQVLELNRPYGQVWEGGEVDNAQLTSSAFGVGLYQAVDVYQRTERAIKYGLFFIALTFLTFFAWEHATGLRLHPFQYLLVGLALSTFYVLLLALSEHILFLAAYAIATAALVSVMGVYISGALRSARRGLVAATAMTVVYGLLYALIVSEDYALLMGAIALFAALSAVMLTTRKIDWYAVRSGERAAERV
ncbi:MAG TPA: cell envelope integrity protein CreD [Steroidobacteraceae bacterium]